jgi:hypothetical protein
MILRSVLFVFLSMSVSAWAQKPSDSDELAIQRDALSKTLEQPLRTHLLKRGYTLRNAAIAADSLLDIYARCLASKPQTNSDSEPEVTYFRLGEAMVSAYKSHCLNKFLTDVAGSRSAVNTAI